MAPSSGSGMSAIPPLSGDQQTFGERAKTDAIDPEWTFMIRQVLVGPSLQSRRSLLDLNELNSA
jgi:hypothetical protein